MAEKAQLKHMSESAAEATMWGSFVNDLMQLRQGLWDIPSVEASVIDPQPCLFLVSAYSAFVDVGDTKE